MAVSLCLAWISLILGSLIFPILAVPVEPQPVEDTSQFVDNVTGGEPPLGVCFYTNAPPSSERVDDAWQLVREWEGNQDTVSFYDSEVLTFPVGNSHAIIRSTSAANGVYWFEYTYATLADWLRLVIECCLVENGAAAAWYYIKSCSVNKILPTEKDGYYNGQEVVVMFDAINKWPPGPE